VGWVVVFRKVFQVSQGGLVLLSELATSGLIPPTERSRKRYSVLPFFL